MNVKIYGSDNPTICIISSMNKRSEDYAYLFEELSKRGINENNCKFITFESKNRPVYYSDFIENSKEIENLVNISNPELVVTVGDNISSYFIGNSFSGISRNNGSVYKRKFGINEFKIMPIFHPSYILRKGLQEEYSKTIKKIILIASGSIPDQVISDCNSSSIHEFKDETIICLNSLEFDEFCKKEIDNFDLIAYDIETNAKEKTSKNYEVVGFSLASNSKKGCYVVLDSLDYKMDKIHIKNVEDRLRKILSSKRIMVYNYMHEELATLRWLGIEMENVDDLFCLVKLLMGNADRYLGNGGLKLQCEMNLNTKDWSEDLDLYMEYFRKIDDEESRTKLRNLLLNYYEDYEIDSLINLVKEKYSDNSVYSGKVISYGVVPYKLIGKYGGIDSSILFDLKEFYENRINELNKEMGIDLRKGYNNWMCHHIAGYTLERNGAFFDNEKASEVEEWCSSVMIESLSNMIKSSLSEEYLKSKIYPNFIVYLKDNYLAEMLGDNAIPVRLYKSSALISLDYRIKDNKLEELINRMSLTPNKKGQFKLEIGNIETVAKNFLVNYKEIYKDWYKKFINDFNSEKHTVQEMKRLMNPTATSESWKDFLTSILINDDIRYAKLYNILIEVVESPNFILDRYSNDDRKLMELVIKLKSLDVDLNKKFKIFCKFFGSERYLRSNYLKRKINEALSYKIESMKECYIIELYNFYTMCGVNIEDKSTWTESFEFLCNLRKYKKASKIITTYINGKIGRNSVWYVDEDSFRNGDKFTIREIQYNDVSDEKEIVNKIPIYQSSFMVDMADTGRWKSGMHCLPAGDTIKQLYTSRFNGGIIAMPDCSQAEVRMLAAVCQDENLLKAFRQEGMDIHKYVASLCLEGSTRIKLLDGTNPTIEELYNSDKKEFYVYSVDDNNNGRLVPGLAHDVRITKQVTELIEVELDSDDVIRCTGNHPFRTRYRGYVNAEDLEINESISSLYTKFDRGYEMFYDLDSERFEYTHRIRSEQLAKIDNVPQSVILNEFFKDHREFLQNNGFDIIVNHKVKAIRKIKLNKPINVYDLTVDRYHNFCIACSNNSGIFVHNCFHNGDIEAVTKTERKIAKGAVFGILYGESVESFAESFTHGDLNEANKIFGYFFNSFPKIKEYVDDAHNQFLTTNKISLRMMNRFINLESAVQESGGDKNKVLRQSQNYIIQGQTCLSGDTKIKLLNGKSKAIKKLADENPEKIYLYSYDSERDKIVPSVGIMPRKTKRVNKIIRITFDNNKFIDSTLDHKYLTRSGTYVEASELKIGDSIMSMCTNNHKIISIEKVNEEIDVYDLSVPKYNNFVVDLEDGSGVVVHNCDLAGLILYNVCKFIKDNNLKSKPFCFIHDSIEIDIHPDETFLMLDKLKPLFNSYPWETFGVPMASDIVFSSNMGAEIDTVNIDHDEKYNEVNITLEGYEDDINEVIKLWNNVYDVCDLVENEDLGEKYVPNSGLFQEKVTFSKLMGTYRKEVKRTYHVIRKKELLCQ